MNYLHCLGVVSVINSSAELNESLIQQIRGFPVPLIHNNFCAASCPFNVIHIALDLMVCDLAHTHSECICTGVWCASVEAHMHCCLCVHCHIEVHIISAAYILVWVYKLLTNVIEVTYVRV